MQPTPNLTAAVAAQIRGELARKKLRYGALAEFMGRDPKTVSRLLNSNRAIDLTDLERIGLFLGIDPIELVARALAA